MRLKLIKSTTLVLLSIFAIASIGFLKANAQSSSSQRAITADSQLLPVSPSYWDMYFNKKDRTYLDGIWKLKFGKNVLSKKFMKEKVTVGRLAKGKGFMLKDGVAINYSDFKNDIGLKKRYFATDYDDSGWIDALVPMPWNRFLPKHDNEYFGGIGYYRKNFTISASKRNRRCFIYFMNVDVIARVWVNGKLLTKKDNVNMTLDSTYRVAGAWMNFFEYEIPKNILNYGNKKNVVTVRVFAKGMPCYWRKPSPGGITAPVWLEFRNPAFANNINITPFYKKKGIKLNFSLNGAQASKGTIIIKPWESQYYSFPGKSKTYKQQFETSNGKFTKRFYLPELITWSPDKPALYSLEIVDKAGRILGIERFGISVMETRNGKFYLNGKNIFLFGLNTHHAMFDFSGGGSPADYCQDRKLMNENNQGRNILKSRKKSGFNYMRIHTGPAAPWCFSICDEVGLIASDEWTPYYGEAVFLDPDDPEKEVEYLFRKGYGFYLNDKNKLQDKYKNYFSRWMNSNKRFPSLLLFNGGNEPLAFKDKDFQSYAKGLYKVLDKQDIRSRLFAPASGCHIDFGKGSSLKPGEGDAKLPSTYWDFHNYGPQVKGSILDTRHQYYDRSIKLVYKLFGRKNIAIINGETYLGFTSEKNEKTVDSRWNFTAPQAKIAVADLLKNGLKGQPLQLSAIHHGLYSLFDYKTMCKERMLWLKKHIENIRYAIPEMQGYALHIADNWWMRKIKDDKRAKNEWGSFEMNEFAMAQAPTQIMINGLHEISLFAGEKSSQDFVIVNNTSTVFTNLQVAISIGEKAIKNISVGNITSTSINPFKVDFSVPSTFTTGDYTMTLSISENNKLIATNKYDVFILKKSYPLKRYKTIYVMDSKDKTAEKLAVAMKLKPLPFDGGHKSEFLIVAPGALAVKSNTELTNWIKKGGRALIMEQAVGTKNPWLKQGIETRKGFTWPISSVAVKKTSIINRDLHFRNFGYWRKNAIAYTSYFPKLTQNALIIGNKPGYNYWRGLPPNFGMVAVTQNVGRGAYIWTQLKLADNFSKDAAAYCIARNLLLALMEKKNGVAITK